MFTKDFLCRRMCLSMPKAMPARDFLCKRCFCHILCKCRFLVTFVKDLLCECHFWAAKTEFANEILCRHSFLHTKTQAPAKEILCIHRFWFIFKRNLVKNFLCGRPHKKIAFVAFFSKNGCLKFCLLHVFALCLTFLATFSLIFSSKFKLAYFDRCFNVC